MDDYSRATWTHLLSSKASAFDIIKSFSNTAETQFHSKIQCERSGNALELGWSREATAFFQSKGIAHQTSCIDTPQQNGVVERKHKHLLETLRALRFQSNLPIKYWGECVLTTTYLINRFPTRIFHGLTPYEILFGHSPEYKHWGGTPLPSHFST